jgi:hypothetical protein
MGCKGGSLLSTYKNPKTQLIRRHFQPIERLAPILTVIEHERTNGPRTCAARSVPAPAHFKRARSDNFRRREAFWSAVVLHRFSPECESTRQRCVHCASSSLRLSNIFVSFVTFCKSSPLIPGNRRIEGNDLSFCNSTARSSEQKRRSTGALQNAGARSNHFCNREVSWTTCLRTSFTRAFCSAI